MTAVEVRIREVEAADEPAIAALTAHLAPDAESYELPTRLASLITHPDHLVLVATTDHDDVVGWIHAFVARRVQTPPFVEIGGLVVTPGQRRFGVGSALCRRVELWAESLGIARIRVRSRTERAESASFFETVGFSRTKMQHVFDRSLGDPDRSAS
jgi:GNAT superfamily N-acetyltransferase